MHDKDDISEGEALSEIMEGMVTLAEMRGLLSDYHGRKRTPSFNTLRMKQQYEENGKAKIGETIKCAFCFHAFKKASYHQKFHRSKCRNRYWNTVVETRKERAIKYNS